METRSVTCSEGNGKAVYTGWSWYGIAAYSGSFQTPAALPLRESELLGMLGRVCAGWRCLYCDPPGFVCKTIVISQCLLCTPLRVIRKCVWGERLWSIYTIAVHFPKCGLYWWTMVMTVTSGNQDSSYTEKASLNSPPENCRSHIKSHFLGSSAVNRLLGRKMSHCLYCLVRFFLALL